MSTRREELLAAVLAEPSRENCGVYADHLLELGDARGELITTELALELAPEVRIRRELRAIRHRLIQAHQDSWWPWSCVHHGRRNSEPLETFRGFLQKVVVYAWHLRDGSAGAVLASEPIRSLELDDVSDASIAALVGATARLERLALRSNLSSEALARLGAWPGVAEVRELIFHTSSTYPAGPAFTPGQFERVEKLHILGSDHTELTGWARLTELRGLAVRSGRLLPADIQRMFSARVFARLEELDLSYNWLDDRGAARLVDHAHAFPVLRRLDLSGSRMGETGRRAVRAGFPAATVRVN